MKDETIRAGDLVVVVRPISCCGNAAEVGKVFRVLEVQVNALGVCEHCNAIGRSSVALVAPRVAYDLGRLKKIPPLADEEGRGEAIGVEDGCEVV